MGRTKDQYIDHLNDLDELRREGRHRYDLNTLDQDDPQNREIQDRKPDNNQSRSLRNNLNHLDKPTERDRNVIDDRQQQV